MLDLYVPRVAEPSIPCRKLCGLAVACELTRCDRERLETVFFSTTVAAMAARAALGRAFLASGVTILGLGAATMVVSSASLGVARVVVTQNKKKTAISCFVCHGKKKVDCDVCGGDKAIRYHPFKTMPLSHSRMPLTACAMCSATGEQTCLNCLGEGTVNPTITLGTA